MALRYINLDCGYSTGFRGADGTLTVNTDRYPHGMVWLGDQIHQLGLKFGMCVGGLPVTNRVEHTFLLPLSRM